VIVKVISRPEGLSKDARADSANAAKKGSVAYVRRALDIPLRVVDVMVDAPQNSWQTIGDKLVLLTFPNRVTSYSFGAVNRGASPRDLSLRFFAPPAPVDLATLSDAQIKQFLSQLKPVGQLAIAAASDGEPHFAAPPKAEEQAAAAPAPAAPGPPAKEPAVPAAEPATEPPMGPPLKHGLLVEVSDAKDPRQTYVKQIEIVPQRPRRYVAPEVSYNARLERIEVKVRPRLASLLPPGPVTIECQIAEGSANVTQGKLRDVLTPPDGEARLFVNVPANPPGVATLHLNVDGYPRAFVYHVPCGAHVVDVPEEANLASFRIRKTAWPDYQPPVAVTPVEAQVDSAVGTFESGSDLVQVALDENMDQQLGPEIGLRFPTDRQVEAFLQGLGEDGLLALDTRVADHRVPLLTDRLQNVRVLVHGQLAAGAHQVNAPPVTLNIDGAAPNVNFVEVSPYGGFVAVGTALDVSVTASDEMSGVQKVEVGFDLNGTGEFSEKAPPIGAVPDPARYFVDPKANPLGPTKTPIGTGDDAKRAPTERWIAKLPTDGVLGIQTLLVRATDKVGNASEYYGKRVQILTPEQAAIKTAQQLKAIEGTVIFQERVVPSAKVALLDAEAKEVATATAAEDGKFSLPGVAPGKYALNAEGVINNVPRFGLQELMVEVAPGPVLRADVSLK
jgi:hypothetical protein